MLDGEQQLILRAIRGEAPAFGSLYDHYQPQIYRFIYLKVSHREEAEDLTHQVFLHSWIKIHEYTFEGFPFSSWLYRIARNAVIDYYRTQKTAINLEIISEDPNEDSQIEISLPELTDQSLNLSKIKQAIQALKPIEQDIIILRFVEDLSPEEVGLLTAKTPQAVRLIQHRAIKNLKQILSN